MKIHLVLILLCALVSCSREKHNFRIEGKVQGLEKETIYLYQRSLSGTLPVDSVLINEKGKFTLEGYTALPNFYILFVHQDEYINLLIHPEDKIGIEINADHFSLNYFIEGSPDSRLISKLVKQQAKTLDRISEISNEYEMSLDKPGFPAIKRRLDSLYEKVVGEHKQYSVELIRDHPESLVSLMTLYQQLGRQTSVFNYRNDFRFFEQVDSALCIHYPGSEAVKDLNRKVTELRERLKVEIGSRAPLITLSDSSGVPVPLQSLKGKVVLINFWASWSPASLQENRDLNRVYKRFQPAGFEIYQVSLDKTRKSWTRSLREENPPGIHVSDLLYWDSPCVKTYHLDQIPANLLIDRSGIIIARDIASESLEKLLTDRIL